MSYEISKLLQASEVTLKEILRLIEESPSLSLKSFNPNQTAIVVIDMVNGFVKEGPMSSPRIQTIIPPIAHLMRAAKEGAFQLVAFADSHEESSVEFLSYPPHCLCGTAESEIVDELKEIGGYQLIHKASTNGFLEAEFHAWLQEHQMVENFILVGDCTDICVEQFAITLKTYFNTINRQSRIIVPVNATETYDLGAHHGDLMHLLALYKMQMNGIELVQEIND